MDVVSLIALSMGLAWASGINLYAAVFMLGYLGATGYIILPDSLQILADPLVMTAAAVMYCIEFFADKIPGIDSGWDSLHTFIRIPAGAMLAAAAMGDTNPAIEFTAGLLGGSLAAASHAAKAGGTFADQCLSRTLQQLGQLNHRRSAGACRTLAGDHASPLVFSGIDGFYSVYRLVIAALMATAENRDTPFWQLVRLQ